MRPVQMTVSVTKHCWRRGVQLCYLQLLRPALQAARVLRGQPLPQHTVAPRQLVAQVLELELAPAQVTMR